MSQAFRQIASAIETGATVTTIAVAYGSNNLLNSLLFCTVWQYAFTTLGTISVADSNGAWTALPAITFNTGVNSNAQIQSFYKLKCAAGANTVTATVSGSVGIAALNLTIGEWTGADTLDQHKEAAVASTQTPATGTVINTQTDIAIGYAGGFFGAAAWDNGSDATYTVRTANPYRCSISSKENVAATTYGFTDHCGSAATMGVGIATFYAALPPAPASLSQASAEQGATVATFTVTGTNFDTGGTSTLSFSGTGITVNSYGTRNGTTLVANITIDPAAALTARDVIVTNADTQTGTLAAAFTITSGVPGPPAEHQLFQGSIIEDADAPLPGEVFLGTVQIVSAGPGGNSGPFLGRVKIRNTGTGYAKDSSHDSVGYPWLGAVVVVVSGPGGDNGPVLGLVDTQ